MQLSDRKKEILRAVVEQYVDTAEPVSSKVISAELPLSSATIRNEMAALESAGLLEQPHTSAGRVPTSAGYRIYVDELMQRHRLSIEETEQLNRALERKLTELDHVIAYAGQVVSKLTSLPAYTLTRARTGATATRFDFIEVDERSFILVMMLDNDTVKNKLFHLPSPAPEGFFKRAATVFGTRFTDITQDALTESLILSAERACGDRQGIVAAIVSFIIEVLTEDSRSEYSIAGGARLFEYPEFRDIDKASRLLGYITGEEAMRGLPTPEENANTKITIGAENLAEELRDSSVVVTRYDMGDDTELLIGVIGPTRMDYSRVLSRLQYLARRLGGGADPPVPPGLSDGHDKKR